MRVKLLAYTPEPEKLIACAAKNCYSSSSIDELMENQTPDKIEKFLNMLADIGHESPVEHVSFTFAIEDVSRVLLSQLTRHRIASYSVQSQRYVKLNQFKYYIPECIVKSHVARKLFIEMMEHDQEAYDKLTDILMSDYLCKIYGFVYELNGNDRFYYKRLDTYMQSLKINGVKNGDAIFSSYKDNKSKAEKHAIENARYVFPNACTTNIVMTMNARSLLNFFELRCCNRAQTEIRELADEILKLCQSVAPIVFKNAGASCMNGKCSEGNMSCGHPRKREEYKN